MNPSWHWEVSLLGRVGKVDEYQGYRRVRRPGGLLEVLAISTWRVMDMEPGSVKTSGVRLGDVQNGGRVISSGEIWSCLVSVSIVGLLSARWAGC